MPSEVGPQGWLPALRLVSSAATTGAVDRASSTLPQPEHSSSAEGTSHTAWTQTRTVPSEAASSSGASPQRPRARKAYQNKAALLASLFREVAELDGSEGDRHTPDSEAGPSLDAETAFLDVPHRLPRSEASALDPTALAALDDITPEHLLPRYYPCLARAPAPRSALKRRREEREEPEGGESPARKTVRWSARLSEVVGLGAGHVGDKDLHVDEGGDAESGSAAADFLFGDPHELAALFAEDFPVERGGPVGKVL